MTSPRISFVPQSIDFIGFAPSLTKPALELIEQCGRVAWKTEPKGNPLSFVKMLIDRGHTSVLEHSNITIKMPTIDSIPLKHYFAKRYEGMAAVVSGSIRSWLQATYSSGVSEILSKWCPEIFSIYSPYGAEPIQDYQLLHTHAQIGIDKLLVFHIVCDRGISHEIVRHRTLQFTQESTRYVNYDSKGFTFIQPEYNTDILPITQICKTYSDLLSQGHKAQIARDILPNLLKTELYVSGRADAWNHFVNLREPASAHPRIRKLATYIRTILEQHNLRNVNF